MCGIAGILARSPDADVTHRIEALTHALAHRGPDGSGIKFLRNRSAAFGHRRLSIVDLSTGDQPMQNEDGRLWIVFNGEIYNHAQLRYELEARGHAFRTLSDTEVILHGFEEWGSAIVSRLNGIFAFAIYDGRTAPGDVWLARDPVGVKPLYVGRAEIGLWFASELSAARQVGLVDTALRPEALAEYLTYRFVPAPDTFFKNVWKLPPGHLCRLPLSPLPMAPTMRAFANRFAPASLPRGAGEWREALKAELKAAVRRQLMSDVPVASMLSGGVDSTVVTHLMAEALPKVPQAFAIGFVDAINANELAPARRSAEALRVPLAEMAVTEDQFIPAWPSQIAALGEPVANSGVLLVGFLSHLVQRTHKVVLSGQGADEPLGGYARHAAQRLFPVLKRLGPLLTLVPESMAQSDRLRRLRRIAAPGEEADRFASIMAVFGRDEIAELVPSAAGQDVAAPVRRWLALEPAHDPLNRLLITDARLSLADDLLTVADFTSMACSVELRVPFLDLEWLALVERMPGRYKVSRLGERKWLYRQAVTDLLPEKLRSRLTGFVARTGAKQGFSTPVDRWYARWLAHDAESYLLGPHALTPQSLESAAVRRVLVEARDQRLPRSRQMTALYVLETWLRSVAGTGPSVEQARGDLRRAAASTPTVAAA